MRADGHDPDAGRALDDQLRVNEIPLYPAQIREVLAHTRAAQTRFELGISERRVVVHLQVTKELFADTMRSLEDLKREIEDEFMTRLGIESEVLFVERF